MLLQVPREVDLPRLVSIGVQVLLEDVPGVTYQVAEAAMEHVLADLRLNILNFYFRDKVILRN